MYIPRKIPRTKAYTALVGACALLACLSGHAADVFAPPSLESISSSDQNARIARLEEALNKALVRLEKSAPESGAADEVKLDAAVKLPPPPAKSAATNARAADQALSSMSDEPRILGVMNDLEIYIQGGVVRQRSISAASHTLLPLPIGGKN